MAEAWNCSLSAAVERLALEADERYAGILFPETKLFPTLFPTLFFHAMHFEISFLITFLFP
jgi:hypothetical protein